MAARPDSKTSEEKGKSPKRGKGFLVAAVVSILVAAAVGAGWYFTRPAIPGEDGEDQAARKPAEVIFVNLEPFTVNLADEGGERLAQIAVVLQLDGKQSQATLSKNLPVVRNGILLLLSSQHSKTLLTLEGKLALADEIALRTGTAIGWQPERADADEEKPSPARKVSNGAPKQPRPHRAAPSNPVVAVHFSQLLVQ